MKPLHIIQAGVSNGDKAVLMKIARGKRSVSRWNVPKHSLPGDEVVVFMQGHGFFATTELTSMPIPLEGWKNRYKSSLANIRLIDPPISLSSIQREIPQLLWAKYPRIHTTLTESIAKAVRLLISNRRKTSLPSLDESSLEGASLAELRKVAMHKSKNAPCRPNNVK